MNQELETALLHALNAQDIASLVALARQEGSRADAVTMALGFVLQESGPIRVKHALLTEAKRGAIGFQMAVEDGIVTFFAT